MPFIFLFRRSDPFFPPQDKNHSTTIQNFFLKSGSTACPTVKYLPLHDAIKSCIKHKNVRDIRNILSFENAPWYSLTPPVCLYLIMALLYPVIQVRCHLCVDGNKRGLLNLHILYTEVRKKVTFIYKTILNSCSILSKEKEIKDCLQLQQQENAPNRANQSKMFMNVKTFLE